MKLGPYSAGCGFVRRRIHAADYALLIRPTALRPFALGYGAGGEARQPLGIAVVGGLLFSQLLTLYLTPTFYVSLERFTQWLRRGPARYAQRA